MMDVFLQLTFTGLANGMVYALVAVGFVIIYKASDVINFAQGEFLLLGAYLAFAFIAQFGLPWSLGVVATLAAALVVGLVVERFVLRPLIGEPIISMIMVTIGLSSVLKALVHAIWGATPHSFPAFLPSTPIDLMGVVVTEDRILIIVLAAALLALFTLFFRHTRDGIAMRAIADDQQAALSMGISIKRVLAVAWAMSAAAAAIAGIMVANMVGVSHDISFVGLRVFPVVILGGLDSIPGAIVGGAIIGLLESYTGGYVGEGLNLIVPFIVLIVVLMVRPYGLFGKRIIERV
jgi:branched-chain amino acid transport system permease protein